MKHQLSLLILIFGLSFSVQAKYFNFEKPGIKCTTEKMLPMKELDIQIAAPKYVFAEGEYHPITSNTYPFYTPHKVSTFVMPCYKPNTPAPLGTLWLKSFSESSYVFKPEAKNNMSMLTLNPSLNLEPSYKLCTGCKSPFKPSAAFHLKHREKLVYYYNGL